MGRIFCFPVFSRKNKMKLPFPSFNSSVESKPSFLDALKALELSKMTNEDVNHPVVVYENAPNMVPSSAHLFECSSSSGQDACKNDIEDASCMFEESQVLASHISDPGLLSCGTSRESPENNSLPEIGTSRESPENNSLPEIKSLPDDNSVPEDKSLPYTSPLLENNSLSEACDGLNLAEDIQQLEEDDKGNNEYDEAPRLTRVEEWVKSIEIAAEPPMEQQLSCEGSPSKAHKSRWTAQQKDMELANNVARALNFHATAAHLNGIGLSVIPSLGAFGHLRVLKLSTNAITKIPPGTLPKSLHSLDLSRNKISAIEGLRELTRLRTLNLSYNRITRIGQGLSSCTAIRELYLAGNKISEVEGLHRLTKLALLDLSFNRLASTKALGQIAANYTSLLSLDLVGNPVVTNVGEEHLKRYVMGVVHNLAYLNRRPVSKRESSALLRSRMSGNGTSPSSSSSRSKMVKKQQQQRGMEMHRVRSEAALHE